MLVAPELVRTFFCRVVVVVVLVAVSVVVDVVAVVVVVVVGVVVGVLQFKRAMLKNFSLVDMGDARAISSLVRAASKLSIEELAMVTGGSEEDAGTIISVRRRFGSCTQHIVKTDR